MGLPILDTPTPKSRLNCSESATERRWRKRLPTTITGALRASVISNSVGHNDPRAATRGAMRRERGWQIGLLEEIAAGSITLAQCREGPQKLTGTEFCKPPECENDEGRMVGVHDDSRRHFLIGLTSHRS